VADLATDDAAWDAFVEGAPNGQYLQLSPWRDVKRPNGWGAFRVAADGGSGPIGAQVLTRRLGPLPLSIGYAPAGPPATAFDAASLRAFTDELRAAARRHRLSHVTVDPTLGGAEVLEALRSAGWRKTKTLQVDRSWVVDLHVPEDDLWQGMRSKWRQYVQKSRRSGFVVVDAGADGIDDLFRIVVETADRAGFVYRSRDTYRRVYEAYSAGDRARVLLCRAPDGEAVAALMLVRCGTKVVEPYGGMTAAGAEGRANYLLKWEAMRTSRERGATLYDMWGMATAGITQFKQGFGGREIEYVGAWDLVVNPLARTAFKAAHALRVQVGRLRRGDRRRTDD